MTDHPIDVVDRHRPVEVVTVDTDLCDADAVIPETERPRPSATNTLRSLTIQLHRRQMMATDDRTCSYTGCERYAPRDLCRAHQQQARRGQPLTELRPRQYSSLEEAVLLNSQQADTGCWLWTGPLHKNGYGWVGFRGTRLRAHHASYLAHIGKIPAGLFIDHKCRVKSCVNPDHLHAVTKKENAENVGLSRANSSGVRGVSWDAKNRKWTAAVVHHGRPHWAGRHTSLKDAERAVIAMRNRLYTNNLADTGAVT